MPPRLPRGGMRSLRFKEAVSRDARLIYERTPCMSGRNLQSLFRPRSVALIGASDRPHSIGATVMRNLLRGGFAGPIWPVNPRHASVAGLRVYRTVAALPAPRSDSRRGSRIEVSSR